MGWAQSSTTQGVRDLKNHPAQPKWFAISVKGDQNARNRPKKLGPCSAHLKMTASVSLPERPGNRTRFQILPKSTQIWIRGKCTGFGPSFCINFCDPASLNHFSCPATRKFRGPRKTASPEMCCFYFLLDFEGNTGSQNGKHFAGYQICFPAFHQANTQTFG